MTRPTNADQLSMVAGKKVKTNRIREVFCDSKPIANWNKVMIEITMRESNDSIIAVVKKREMYLWPLTVMVSLKFLFLNKSISTINYLFRSNNDRS